MIHIILFMVIGITLNLIGLIYYCKHEQEKLFQEYIGYALQDQLKSYKQRRNSYIRISIGLWVGFVIGVVVNYYFF